MAPYQPISTLPTLASKMGIQATSPSLTTQTSTPATLPQNQVYTPPASKPYVSPSSLSFTPQNSNISVNIPNYMSGTTAPKAPTATAPVASATNPLSTNVASAGTTSPVGFSPVNAQQQPTNPTDIKALQEQLVREGYMTQAEMNTGPGIYGPKTTAAVAARQAKLAGGTGTQTSGTQTQTSAPVTNTAPVMTTPVTSTTPISTTGGTSGAGSVTSGTSSSTSSSTTTPPAGTDSTKWAGYLQGLTDVKNKYQPLYEQKAKELADIATKQSEQNYGLVSQGGEGTIGFGRSGMLQDLAAKQQSIKQKELDQIMNAYQAEAGILGQQVGATQPQAGAAFYGTPETGNLKGTGSVFQAGTLSGQQSMGQQYPQMKASVDQAGSIKSSIQNLLASTPINPTDFTDINKAINFLTGKVGSPQMQTLGNYIGQYVATLAPILGTNTNAIAQDMVNAQAQGGSISDVLNNLQNMANAKLQIFQNVGSGTNTPVSTASTFSTPNILGGSTSSSGTQASTSGFSWGN